MELYEVGGCVRDEIMGVKSKDIDFSVVLEGNEGPFYGAEPFHKMKYELERMGFEIFVEKPEYLTIRARFPKVDEIVTMEFASTYAMPDGTTASWVPTPPRTMDISKYRNLTADFVLARKEADYTDGRRPDTVVPGTLRDDLARRDFTMNAMAKDANGVLHDPFNGRADIDDKIIRAVGNPVKRLNEDILRGLRALRLSMTKGFTIEKNLSAVIASRIYRERLNTVSVERQREELEKMFAVDTVKALRLLDEHNLIEALFSQPGLRLMPTMKG